MALRHGGVSRDEMADYLGVSPSTISRWNGDKGEPPKRAFLAQWAMRTGGSLDWLSAGASGGPEPGPGVDADAGSKKRNALDKLTQEKRARARHAGGSSNQQYVPTAA